jgi:hypothetical protein
MGINLSSVLNLSFILLVAVLYSGLIAGVTYASKRAGQTSPIPLYILRVLCGGFLLVTGLLALRGFFRDFSTIPPRPMILFIVGFTGMCILANRAQAMKWLAQIPQSWIILAQSFRIFVEILFFFLAKAALFPQIMTFEGRNFDILIGLSAPILGHFVDRADKAGKGAKFYKLIFAWNIVGLLLVSNALMTALLSAPTPIQRFFVEPSTALVGHFPYIWLPAFVVPYAYLLHMLSLRKLLSSQK